MQRRISVIVLMILACTLLLPERGAALESGWLRIGNIAPVHLAVRGDSAGNREVWSADISGFSVIGADGAVRRQFRWPTYAPNTPFNTTLRIAVTGTPPAAWTIGNCCIGKSGPRISVLVPEAERTREIDLSDGFDVGRAGEGATAIAVDTLGHPWLATTDGLWRMLRGWQTPSVVGDDLWTEVTDAQGQRVYGISSINVAPDRSVWITIAGTPNSRLLQFTVTDEQATLSGSYSVPGELGPISELVFDGGGKLYYLTPQELITINPDGSILAIVIANDLGGQLNSAAFVNGTLWVATSSGLYRRSTVPAPEIAPLSYGPAEYVSGYYIPPAPEIFMGDLITSGPSFDPAGYWYRTDRPIVDDSASRSFYWGPKAWKITRESYRDAPFGTRRVIYFDKARMEVTNPAQPLVTNGLLVMELVTGQIQLGNTTFEQRDPADETVAGDPISINADAPTYASFRGVVTPTSGAQPVRIGQTVSTTIDKQGRIGSDPVLARPQTQIAAYDSVTGHNLPGVFTAFMQQRGLIYTKQGNQATERLIDPLIAIGRPIAEPYWVQTRVSGTPRWVLIQLFERRALTYTPDNPADFQVEMGNVGQHYYAWRYNDHVWERR